MNPNEVQYESRGPIMKYKNRNKHSFLLPRPVEYLALFLFSTFTLMLSNRLNYTTYSLVAGGVRVLFRA